MNTKKAVINELIQSTQLRLVTRDEPQIRREIAFEKLIESLDKMNKVLEKRELGLEDFLLSKTVH